MAPIPDARPRRQLACVRVTLVGLGGMLLVLMLHRQAAAAAPSFEREVAPLLQARCLKCHSGPRPKGDLTLTRRAGLLEGGSSGPALVPGKASASKLFTHVRDHKMPPRQPLSADEIALLRRWIDAGAVWQGPPLVAPARVDNRRAGLDWWSLQPIRRPPVPAVKDTAWVRTPVDAFLRARLEAKGLTPAPEADRRTYLRRVTLDLTGLLPTPAENDAFLHDTAPDAYEKLVDRLLASPAYGERWGRHWLDVVRFAESHGYEMNTLRPNAWPYRDYVVRAFNEDRSFARFVREQLAGDLVGRGDPLTEAATGFLVGGAHDMVGNATLEGRLQQRMDDLFDMVSTTGTTFLGLTVGCARCHDHKFDPILQKDFYGMQSLFAGVQHGERRVQRPNLADSRKLESLRRDLAEVNRRIDTVEPEAGPPGSPRQRPPVNPRRNVEHFAPIEARFVRFTVVATTDGTQPCLDELEVYGPGPASPNLALASGGAKASASSVFPNNPLHRIEHINDGRLGNGRSWISNEPGKGWVQIQLPRSAVVARIVWGRDREQRYRDRLARDYRIEVSRDGKHWQVVAGSWDREAPGRPRAASGTLRALLERRQAIEKQLQERDRPMTVYAGTFTTPEPTFLLKRGDPMQKLGVAAPSAVRALRPSFMLKANATEAERRLALADWIVSPENPLPARVMVNRVWHWHFGQGLVRTPSDFGFNGDRPSHPQLLDYLAAELQANGGHLKPLHRMIVLSAAYRQASTLADTSRRAQAVDSGNRLLWRFPPRRVEAEVLRDTMLQVSGVLDRRMEGPGYNLWDYSGYVIVFKPKALLGPETFRRMVYQFKPRLQQDGTFGAFDCPDATQPAPRRNVSTTALQALNLLNDPFVHDQAERFADRLRREAGTGTEAQVRRAFQLAFGRTPSVREVEAALRLVQAHGLSALCRALFNANEFVFVN